MTSARHLDVRGEAVHVDRRRRRRRGLLRWCRGLGGPSSGVEARSCPRAPAGVAVAPSAAAEMVPFPPSRLLELCGGRLHGCGRGRHGRGCGLRCRGGCLWSRRRSLRGGGRLGGCGGRLRGVASNLCRRLGGVGFGVRPDWRAYRGLEPAAPGARKISSRDRGWLVETKRHQQAEHRPGRRLLRTQVVPHRTAVPLVTDEAPLRIPHAHASMRRARSRTALNALQPRPSKNGFVG